MVCPPMSRKWSYIVPTMYDSEGISRWMPESSMCPSGVWVSVCPGSTPVATPAPKALYSQDST